eukprot:scaffold31088_cov75-Phaeocystis_antarctica.AAC.4
MAEAWSVPPEASSSSRVIRGKMPHAGGQASADAVRLASVSAPGGPNIVCVLPEPVWPKGFRLVAARHHRIDCPEHLLLHDDSTLQANRDGDAVLGRGLVFASIAEGGPHSTPATPRCCAGSVAPRRARCAGSVRGQRGNSILRVARSVWRAAPVAR